MPAINESRYRVDAGWDSIPHLSEQAKKELLDATPPHLRGARAEGIPSMGSGAVYPIDAAEFTIEPFRIPEYFTRGYGLDVGWNKTAAVWGAYDRDEDILYLTSEHYRGEAPPEVHARAIEARGKWMIGNIDPAASGASQVDGKRVIDGYRNAGLTLVAADNAVEAGILEIYQRLATGRLKVFKTLTNWLAEFRLYRRNDKGKIIKKYDHLMDASRYLALGLRNFRTKPVEPKKDMFASGSPADMYFA